MELHDDDKPVGRVLSRREMLMLLGGTGAALTAGVALPRLTQAQEETPLPDCVVKPELSEGPFFVDDQLKRVDIRVDPSDDTIKAGTPLLLIYQVSDVTDGTCSPLANAQVDVWHCDADGVYPSVAGRDEDEMWLRGYQMTDDEGIAKFVTIVPGWYRGRAVHIHFKIRTETSEEESYEFTSQLFFDADDIEEVYKEDPYTERGAPDVENERDFLYRESDGQLTLELNPLTEEELEEFELEAGYSATFDIGLDLSDAAVGASDRWG